MYLLQPPCSALPGSVLHVRTISTFVQRKNSQQFDLNGVTHVHCVCDLYKISLHYYNCKVTF
uniref:Uncharacterized protein n=1 Tax=Anguilla anguilla TaxID=7936 RepID=A0A0E9QHS0_ANGAN